MVLSEVINMKISTRGRYSLRFMIDLAQHYTDGYIALKDIAARQEISKKYLEQIIPFLTRSGLVIASKGHMGGYALSKDPANITVKDIFVSAEGSLAPVSCLESEVNTCDRCEDCLTLPIYQGLSNIVNEYFEGITLESIIDSKMNGEFYVI